MNKKKLSKYFNWSDVTNSPTASRLGIDNSIPENLEEVAKSLALKMDALRAKLGVPVWPTSWYRCLQLNRALHSKDTSQHPRMEAVDFVAPAFGSPYEVCMFLKEHLAELQIDQLIHEYTWVHVSFCVNPAREPRNNTLTLLHGGGYEKGIHK